MSHVGVHGYHAFRASPGLSQSSEPCLYQTDEPPPQGVVLGCLARLRRQNGIRVHC